MPVGATSDNVKKNAHTLVSQFDPSLPSRNDSSFENKAIYKLWKHKLYDKCSIKFDYP